MPKITRKEYTRLLDNGEIASFLAARKRVVECIRLLDALAHDPTATPNDILALLAEKECMYAEDRRLAATPAGIAFENPPRMPHGGD